jgi:PAS domain S-box-containing protein
MDGGINPLVSSATLGDPARAPDERLGSIWRAVGSLMLVGAGYYVAGVVGLIARFPSSGISAIWLATAILLVALMLAPPRMWWLYIVALLPVHLHLVRNFQGNVPPNVMFCQFAGNVTHALLSVMALRLVLGRWAPRLDDFRSMATFILVVGVLVAWIVSAAVVYLFARLGWVDSFWLGWRARSLGNGVGALTVVPLALWAATDGTRVIRQTSLHRCVEFALLILGLVAVGIPVFRGTLPAMGSNPAWLYVPLPFLLWAAVRFNPAGLCLALLLVALLSLVNTMRGQGPFNEPSPVQNTLDVQLFLLSGAVPLLLLSALMSERRRTMLALRSSEARYRAVVDSQTELVCRFLPDTTLTFVNEAYCNYFGKTREALLGRKFLELLPESAREAALAHVQALLLNPQIRTVEHEVLKPDGSVGWQQWVDYLIFEGDRKFREFQATGRDVTERKHAEELLRANEAELRESVARVRELAARLIGAQETERTRISMELHDGVSQRLAALSMGLSALKRHLVGEGLEQLARLQSGAVSLASEIRSLSHELHPGALRHAGLVAALRSNCRELDGRNGVAITFAGGEDLPPLPAEVSLCLFRVAQEALHNLVRHAQAKHASVILARDKGRVRMTVCDDGRGFDLKSARASDGVGLMSMEERVNVLRGSIDIDSHLGRGTEVRVEVPFEEASHESDENHPGR